MSGKFELFKSKKNGQFYFHLKATNGKVILQSEGYAQKAGCEKGIESVRKNASSDNAYKVAPLHFNLTAKSNKQVIGSSQHYKSTRSRNIGIASVKLNGPSAKLVDLTVKH